MKELDASKARLSYPPAVREPTQLIVPGQRQAPIISAVKSTVRNLQLQNLYMVIMILELATGRYQLTDHRRNTSQVYQTSVKVNAPYYHFKGISPSILIFNVWPHPVK